MLRKIEKYTREKELSANSKYQLPRLANKVLAKAMVRFLFYEFVAFFT